jgi:AraC-like DNA-binding protein
MSSSSVRTFSDPDAYSTAIRGANVELAVTGTGAFTARQTRIDLGRLWMQRGSESSAGIRHSSHMPGRAFFTFLAQQGPEVTVSGAVLSSGHLVRNSPAQEYYVRTSGRTSWGAMSLRMEDMAVASETLAGRDLMPPRNILAIEPRPDAMARLLRLHEAVGRLAEYAPEIIAHPETSRGLEQTLIEAMVDGLNGSEVLDETRARRQHHLIMRRFFRVLEKNPCSSFYMPEICAAIRVSARTFQACCQEQFGMAPKQYLMLRRLNFVRRDLRKAVPGGTTVTEVATAYGFWNLGRFAVRYKSVFGEKPSDTLSRV